MSDRQPRPQWVRLGREMRRLREKAGLTQTQLGRQVNMSYGTISGIERGVRGTKPEYLGHIDRVLLTNGALYGMWQAMNDGHGLASWFQGAAEFEKAARAIQICQPLLVPGLLQTEGYIRAVMAFDQTGGTKAEAQEGVDARLKRQEILTSEDRPALQVVLDETVLRRPVGGRGTMVAQLDRLLTESGKPGTAIQVVPAGTGYYPALDGVFHLYTLQDRREVLYTETMVSSMAVEDPIEVGKYQRAWSEARGMALPPGASRELMERTKKELG